MEQETDCGDYAAKKKIFDFAFTTALDPFEIYRKLVLYRSFCEPAG